MDDVFELQYPAFLNPFDASDAEVDFDQDGASNLKEYQDGTDPSQPPLASAKIVSVTPADGEAMVNVTRNAVVRFDRPINPDTVDESSFYLQLNQAPVAGQVEVSSTGMFATFFPDQTLPASTQLQVVVDGNLVKDLDGIPLDGDDDGMAGGISRTRFRTLPLTRIDGTNVWGYVKDSLTGEPIAGVTIYVNAFPQASGVTDDEGRFELMNMPAPEFFVHIVGATAIDTPAGYQYPSMGKPIESVPGQTTQVSKGGEPFDIFLPLMALDDVQELSASEVTEVGFGSGGKQTLTGLFPEADPTVWDRVCVDIAPGSARDDKGTIRNEAALIPVPPDRIPEPLPEELPMPLVISVQVFNATRFDVPAPVTFPNLPDPVTGEVLPPGAKSGLWSYDHDAGRWILQGSMTVSEDGLYLVSDPGVGIRAPGWHGANTGNSGEGGGGDDKDEECEKAKEKMLNSVAQCTAGNFFELLELAPGLGCAVSLASSAIGAS
ncbi:MAG: Ig-like domain-containing protein, partial [Verrucomicrobiae bacterium]|nr:Ig-like domain-containing protein [Verrucomicrobiae bacterium]